MSDLETGSAEHLQFVQLCADVEDYEPLPDPPGDKSGPEEQGHSLDEEILAGLVSP
jgi:hypothetical protein